MQRDCALMAATYYALYAQSEDCEQSLIFARLAGPLCEAKVTCSE